MPEARIILAADAVVAELLASPWGSQFDCSRGYLVARKLEDLKNAEIIVVPAEKRKTMVTRKPTYQRQFVLSVGFRKRLEKATEDTINGPEVDALMLLMQELEEWFEDDHFLASYSAARCIDVNVRLLYSPDELEKKHAFFSLLELTLEEIS